MSSTRPRWRNRVSIQSEEIKQVDSETNKWKRP